VTATCPNGHASTTTDYCDQCGAKIEGDPAAAAAPVELPTPSPLATAPGAAGRCPNCQSGYGPDDKFCEVCGYDFAAGTLPAAPVPVPAAPAVEPLTTVQPVVDEGAAVVERAAMTSGPAWEAVVDADRDYYERTSPDEVTFPDSYPTRVFTLTEDEVLIGRRSESRGIHPQIDLSGSPEDSALSRSHAVLRRLADGTWTLVDPGSSNVTVPLKDGDRIYVGAWTRITLRAPASSGAGR
jgi:hypothetical protein